MRFLARRLVLLGFTLVVTSVFIFTLTSVIPGDVGRIILGPFASEVAVRALNTQLGYDQPLITRYITWLIGLLSGDWGRSLMFQVPVLPLVLERLGRSLVLALMSLTMLVLIAMTLGVVAALRRGSVLDRSASTFGIAFSIVPEFVTGVVMKIVFGLWMNLLPTEAMTPPGSSLGTQLIHLLMPATCLVLLFFIYVFRMSRTGTISALDADYTRTAVLKGLPPSIVLRRHVLGNALVPAVAVIGSQLGFFIGGLVVVETVFRYPGLGSLIKVAATQRDVPLLVAGALVVATVVSLGSLLTDVALWLLQPRSRTRA